MQTERYTLDYERVGQNGTAMLKVIVIDNDTGAKSEPVEVTRDNLLGGATRLANLMQHADVAEVERELRDQFGDEAFFVNSSSFVPEAPEQKRWPELTDPAAYEGLAGDIVRAIEPHSEADPAALLLQLLVGYGNAVGRDPHFVADGATHYLNLYLTLVGQTAKGRKGTAWANIMRPLSSADPHWAEAHIVSGLSSGEGLIWQVRDAVEKQVPIKSKGRFTGEYETVVEHPAVEDKRLLVQEGEFASVLKVMAREGNTLSPIIRSAWDGGNLRSMVKNSPANATGAHISIIGHITKDELRRYLDKTEAANGLGNRFLWACVRRSKCLPDGGELHTVDFAPLVKRLTAALTFGRRTGQMRRDDEARQLWHAVYPELSEGGTGLVGSLTSRAEAQVMRLACVYALLDSSESVCVNHLNAALSIWDYCYQSVNYVFGTSMGDPVADELLNALRCSGGQGMTRTDISRFFGNNREAQQISNALMALQERGLVRSGEDTSTGGRKAERWFATYGTKETKETK